MDRILQANERVLVELPPELPLRQVVTDISATMARGRAARSARTSRPGSRGTGRTRGRRTCRTRSRRAGRASRGRARGATSAAAATGAGGDDVARTAVLATMGVAGLWQQCQDTRAGQAGKDELVHWIVDSEGSLGAGSRQRENSNGEDTPHGPPRLAIPVPR